MVNHDSEYLAKLADACKRAGVRANGIGSHAMQTVMRVWPKWAPDPIVAAEFARRTDRLDELEREQVDAIVADMRLEDPAKTQAPTNALLSRFRKAIETYQPRRFGPAVEEDAEPDAETKPDVVLIAELAELADDMRARGHRGLAAACDRRRKWIESGRPAGGPYALRVGQLGVEAARESSKDRNATGAA